MIHWGILRSFQAPGRFGTCHTFRYLHIRSLELPTTCQVTWGIEIFGPCRGLGLIKSGHPQRWPWGAGGWVLPKVPETKNWIVTQSLPVPGTGMSGTLAECKQQGHTWTDWGCDLNWRYLYMFAICIYTNIHIHIRYTSLYHHYTLYVPYATSLNLIQTGYLGGSAASPRLQQSRDNPCPSPSFGSRESLEQPRHQMTREKLGMPDQNVQQSLVALWWSMM